MEIQLQLFQSVPHPPATSLLNTHFTYHLCLTTVNHQPALNTQFLTYLTTVNHQLALNSQFLTYHVCLILNHHVLNTQATRVVMQTHQTITEFADDIPNPTRLNHELQSRILEHVYKTKHATEIASD